MVYGFWNTIIVHNIFSPWVSNHRHLRQERNASPCHNVYCFESKSANLCTRCSVDRSGKNYITSLVIDTKSIIQYMVNYQWETILGKYFLWWTMQCTMQGYYLLSRPFFGSDTVCNLLILRATSLSCSLDVHGQFWLSRLNSLVT